VGVTAGDGSLGNEAPTAFVATTENVYVIPLVRPEHEAVRPVTTHDAPAGSDDTEYAVTGDPPSLAGATHETAAELSPADAETPVGTDGAVGGAGAAAAVITFEGTLGRDEPTLLVATALKVYALPGVKPVQSAVKPDTTHVPSTGYDVTAYDVIVAPPSSAGGFHDTVADAAPADAVNLNGAVGKAGVGVTVTFWPDVVTRAWYDAPLSPYAPMMSLLPR
jgi:hypothetical protein